MNPFALLGNVQETYKTYVRTFQRFKNPAIEEWVLARVEDGSLLWRDPYIQLNRRFEQGDSFETLTKDGLLHPETLKSFTVKPDDRGSEVIKLHKHQSRAVHSILGDKANTIVATGTGSGKSFCFGIPILSECLRMKDAGKKGIKAVLIYPMNALANSQYEDFSARMHGTGLKLALYTGQTLYDREQALQRHRQDTGRDTLYDSEVISRDVLQNRDTLPDILMTNSSMLELILTRFEDRWLFPSEHAGILQFLVLDEVHTYTGRQGADVACLIRRLKQHTGTIGALRCIGTSATVESGQGDTRKVISDFASRLFGEPFHSEHVITEEYVDAHSREGVHLSQDVMVTPEILASIDGSDESAYRLADALLGRSLTPAERTLEGLGILLKTQKTAHFLEHHLHEGASSISDLAQKYQGELRNNADISSCKRELLAALFSGMKATISVHGKLEPWFIPKLHGFFSQGRALTACLAAREPHLNEHGDVTCKQCSELGEKDVPTFPLHFCRACGQEFFGVFIQEDHTLIARDLDTMDGEGTPAYLYPDKYEKEEVPLPESWLTKKGKTKKDYQDSEPRNHRYCPSCNLLDCDCDHPNQLQVCIVPVPLLLCPRCGVSYDRRSREFNKLFTFGSVGRSTATDILVGSVVSGLPEGEQKIIAFSDNRQDTALQSAHLNNLHKRLHFRKSLYHALLDAGAVGGKGNGLDVAGAAAKIFEIQQKHDALPSYGRKATGHYRSSSQNLDDFYKRYLEFALLCEMEPSTTRNQQNLEDAGLLVIQFDGLKACADDDPFWSGVPFLEGLSAEVRYDYLSGFLNIMRQNLAINSPYLLKYEVFDKETLSKLDEKSFFHATAYSRNPVGYSDTAESDGGVTVLRLNGSRSLMAWTRKALQVPRGQENEVIQATVEKLESEAFIVEEPIRRGHYFRAELKMIPHETIFLSVVPGTQVQVCPKCGRVYQFSAIQKCVGVSCGSLVSKDNQNNYFRKEYSRPLAEGVALHAEEHSGQVDGVERKNIEGRFRDADDPLNVLVCTPTMELGIDIGHLSSVYLRNVPPSPSNYAQRAGRAGRKSQSSLITTFCGVGSHRGPHDQYFYKNPEKIISGRITAPRFLLDNRLLLQTHMHSLILETLGREHKLPSKPAEILNLDSSPNFPIFPDLSDELHSALEEKRTLIERAIEDAFKKEMETFSWFDGDFIVSTLSAFPVLFDRAFDAWRREYNYLAQELAEINRRADIGSGLSIPESIRRSAIENRRKAMRGEGGAEFYTYRYLGAQGFLPNYAFPTRCANLTFFDTDDSISRNANIALREYAPGNSYYYRGNRYAITHARAQTRDGKPDFQPLMICKECHRAYLGKTAIQQGACPNCQADWRGSHPIENALSMPDMLASRSTNITSDEEERRRLGYLTDSYYTPGRNLESFKISTPAGEVGRLCYEHNGAIIAVNHGTRKQELEDAQPTFTLCTACNRWLFGEETIEKHMDAQDQKRCPRNARDTDVFRDIHLFSRAEHDVMTLDFFLPEAIPPTEAEGFYKTLLHAIRQGIQVSLNVEESEIAGFMTKTPADPNRRVIVLYETAEGGAGALESLKSGDRLAAVVGKACEMLHEGEEGCEKACYDCLCSFYNQMDHPVLNRNLVLPLLQSLKDVTLVVAPSGGNEPQSFEKLLETCESGLERSILTRLREEGYPLPHDGQKTVYEEGVPIARLDFFYEPNIAVFVDGPPHDQDFVQKADDNTRTRLRALGYRVLPIRYDSPDEGIKALADWLGVTP